jgi:antitoxin (DNA-binding transcriptional repressor) of toxin-antitoxin stability system
VKRVGIRELHAMTGKLVSEASLGERIVVMRRGVAVAELRAYRHDETAPVPDRSAWLAKFPRVRGDS